MLLLNSVYTGYNTYGMVYMVNGVRYGVLGVTEVPPLVSLGVLTAATMALLAVDVVLVKRGYGLTE